MSGDEITDIDATGKCVDELDNIPNVTPSEIDAAVHKVKEAALTARIEELGGSEGMQGQPPAQSTGDKIEHYDWLDNLFERVFERWPSTVEAMAMHMESAKEPLTKGQMSAFEGVSSAVERWGGDSQEHYKKYFVDPLPQAVTNQQGVLEELRAGLLSYAAVLKKGRVHAVDLAKEAEKALDALGGGGSVDAGVVLAVIGAAAGVAGAVVSGGTSLTITLAIISGGAGIAGAAASSDGGEEKLSITGGTVSEVLTNTTKAVDDLIESMHKAEREIAVSWNASSDEIEGCLTSSHNLDKATVVPHEPKNDSIPNLTNGGSNVSTDEEDGDFRPRH